MFKIKTKLKLKQNNKKSVLKYQMGYKIYTIKQIKQPEEEIIDVVSSYNLAILL